MNVDAQEAALVVLSMGHNYFSQPTPSTSSATLNSILTTTASPVIPQKRKQSVIEQGEDSYDEFLQQQQQQRLTHSPPPDPSCRSQGAESNDGDPNDTSTEAVDCICGFAVDDGFSIACDECSRWCHSACFGIAPGSVPEKFACWTCKPRSAVDRDKAVRLQRERLGMADGDAKDPKQRRRSSPGSERKQRRGDKKHRPSITQPPPTPTTTPNGPPEDEQVDIDSEPWRDYYVHIVQDVIPGDDTRAKLRHQAVHWRGVSAVSPSPDPVAVKPLSPQSSLNPFLFQNSNPLVLPPAFSLHTTQPIPSQSLITPFRSCITPSSTYLADPLNAYAHLGMPKPYVHLLGPPLDLALDARIVGNHARFARWGCKPNAVLRPILCERAPSKDPDESTLAFGVFATKDMKPNEEIVLGWEWDDGNAVHLLPALLEAPHAFPILASLSTDRPHQIQHIKNQMSNILHALSSTFATCACGALSRDCALTQMAAFVDGHSLGSLFRRKDQLSDLDSEDDTAKLDIGPLVGRKRGFRTRERIPFSGGLGGMQMVGDEDLVGNGKGYVWDGRQPYKEASSPTFAVPPFPMIPIETTKEHSSIVEDDTEMVDTPTREIATDSVVPLPTPPSELVNNPPSEPRPPDPPDGGGDFIVDEVEERMPPKMRKRWMHRELEARKEPSVMARQVGLGITLDSQAEHQLMPPPPVPASMDPTTISSTSVTIKSSPSESRCSPTWTVSTSSDMSPPPPSTTGVSPLASFAQLSLLSPALSCEVSRPPEFAERGSLMSLMEALETLEPGIEGLQADIATMSPPRENSLPIVISSAESGTEGGVVEEDPESTNTSPSVPASGFARTLHIYSRCHDEDDEVDYSPLSPEPDTTEPHSSRTLEAVSYPADDVEYNQASANSTASVFIPSPTPADQTSGPTRCPDTELEPCHGLPSTLPPQSQPPLPKVKLTLKDFALRKKRQREEQALSRTIHASPVTPSPLLDGEEETKSSSREQDPSRKSDPVVVGDDARGIDAVENVVNCSRMFAIDTKLKRDDTLATPNDSRANCPKLLPSPTISFSKPATSALASNGHLRSPLSQSPPGPPLLLPSRPIQQQPSISKIDARDMKQEMIETRVPSLLQRVSGFERSISPISPDPTPMVNRISQEEEGEIGETRMHLFSSRASFGSLSKRDSNNNSQQSLSRNGSHFTHSPPTGPRYYLNQPTSPSRPTPPIMSPIPSAAPNNTNANRPNLPTAPRALRQSMLHHHHRSGSGPSGASHPTPTHSLPSQNNAPGPGSAFIPRGPSADRDKERDKVEWEQRHYRAPPRRAAGSGRGTPWGR